MIDRRWRRVGGSFGVSAGGKSLAVVGVDASRVLSVEAFALHLVGTIDACVTSDAIRRGPARQLDTLVKCHPRTRPISRDRLTRFGDARPIFEDAFGAISIHRPGRADAKANSVRALSCTSHSTDGLDGIH
jgi:hypothetical protein